MNGSKRSKKELPPDHKHCPICGKVIPPELEYCSTKCETIALRQKREEEFARKLMLILLVTFVLVIIIVNLIGR